MARLVRGGGPVVPGPHCDGAAGRRRARAAVRLVSHGVGIAHSLVGDPGAADLRHRHDERIVTDLTRQRAPARR